MNLPVQFPSDTQVIAEEAEQFRALSHQSRLEVIRGLLDAGALMLRNSPRSAFLAEYADQQETAYRRAVREFLARMSTEYNPLAAELIRGSNCSPRPLPSDRSATRSLAVWRRCSAVARALPKTWTCCWRFHKSRCHRFSTISPTRLYFGYGHRRWRICARASNNVPFRYGPH